MKQIFIFILLILPNVLYSAKTRVVLGKYDIGFVMQQKILEQVRQPVDFTIPIYDEGPDRARLLKKVPISIVYERNHPKITCEGKSGSLSYFHKYLLVAYLSTKTQKIYTRLEAR